jgi:fumarate hydratase, class II
LQAIELLANGSRVFARRCIAGLQADTEKCEGNVERSLAMCTALAPVIGYDQAAKIAKVAYEQNRNVREVAYELSGLEKKRVEELLNPKTQTGG